MPTAPDETAIAAWLGEHPDFLQRHPHLLDRLYLPDVKPGKGVADFQSYMVKRLRHDRDEVLESAREVIETSRANMNNQARIHQCVLLLLDARSFEEFIRTITMDFAAILDVDVVALVIENEVAGAVQPLLPGLRMARHGFIELLMGRDRLLLEAGIDGDPAIYGAGAGLVKSQACLRIDIAANAPLAMLAFGSREPTLFQPGQGTELVNFLGQVISRLMRIWLDVGREDAGGCGHGCDHEHG